VTAVTDSRIAEDVRKGLWQDPPTLPARWFYDERGSRLFDEITRLPEYYPTRRETEILQQRSGEIAELTDVTTLLELGSGMSTKTRLLLDALTAGGRSLLFVPLDVSAEVMTEAADRIASQYPTLTVEPMVADFTESLGSRSLRDGIRIVGVSPGPTATDRLVGLVEKRAQEKFGDAARWPELFSGIPGGRVGKPEEIAAMVAFLASPLSDYTSGVVITLDAGVSSRSGT